VLYQESLYTLFAHNAPALIIEQQLHAMLDALIHTAEQSLLYQYLTRLETVSAPWHAKALNYLTTLTSLEVKQ
jgi:hypothetical protein